MMPERPETKAATQPVLLRDLVHEAFAPHMHPEAPSMRATADAMAEFLFFPEPNGAFFIDRRAALHGLLRTGMAQQVGRARPSTARWAVSWLREHGMGVNLRPKGDMTPSEMASQGATVRFSDSMADHILPHAHALAERSVGRDRFDARHLLFALLANPGSALDSLVVPAIRDDQVQALLSDLATHIIRSREPGENVEVWQQYVIEPERNDADAEAARPDPEPAPITPTPRPESLRTLSDQPATTDRLGREAFATVLAERLRDGREAGGGEGALMAHIHGPWGYGKSSALNFLKQRLESGGDPWLVVEFNAWKHHRIRPPWWSLISAIYEAARKAPEIRSNWRLWWIWWSWRLRADWGPVALVAALSVIGLVSALTTADDTVKLVSSLITAGAALFAATRVLSFGSAKAAQAYAELKTDPYRPVIQLYCQLVGAVGRPVAVFVDDIDRCEGSYVVELIEGIQTLLRQEPVTYVIAAERKWICSAFEKKYADFTVPIGEPARPLGYLFLDKLFQISAPLPGLSPEMRKGYWAGLLDTAPAAAAPLSAQEAAEQVAGAQTLEALNQVIAEAPEAQKPQLRAAAAMEITQSRHSEAIEHRLQSFADLLEPNPRAMKRLVNAVGMAQARAFLEGRNVALDTLTRWTLIELRWPLLADHLAGNVALVAALRGEAEAPALPVHLAPLATDRQLRAIVVPEDGPGLDAVQLQALLA